MSNESKIKRIAKLLMSLEHTDDWTGIPWEEADSFAKECAIEVAEQILDTIENIE